MKRTNRYMRGNEDLSPKKAKIIFNNFNENIRLVLELVLRNNYLNPKDVENLFKTTKIMDIFIERKLDVWDFFYKLKFGNYPEHINKFLKDCRKKINDINSINNIYKNIYFLTLKILERLKFDVMTEIIGNNESYYSSYLYSDNDKFLDKFETEIPIDFIKEWKNNKSRGLEIAVQPYFDSVKEGSEVCSSLWDCTIYGESIELSQEFVDINRPLSSDELNIIKIHKLGIIRFEKSIKNEGNSMVVKVDSLNLTNMIDTLLLYGTVHNTIVIKKLAKKGRVSHFIGNVRNVMSKNDEFSQMYIDWVSKRSIFWILSSKQCYKQVITDVNTFNETHKGTKLNIPENSIFGIEQKLTEFAKGTSEIMKQVLSKNLIDYEGINFVKCSYCKNKGKYICSDCNLVSYCGKQCQRKDLQSHIKYCKALKSLKMTL